MEAHIPCFRVALGFGLHLGWSYEGTCVAYIIMEAGPHYRCARVRELRKLWPATGIQNPPFFLRILFFLFCPVRPTLPQAIFFPKIASSGTSDLLFLVEKRQLAGAGFGGRFWTGSPHRKKGKFLFLACETKVRNWGQKKKHKLEFCENLFFTIFCPCPAGGSSLFGFPIFSPTSGLWPFSMPCQPGMIPTLGRGSPCTSVEF